VDWLLRNHRNWIDAELALNEGGDGVLREGRRIGNYVQASEKVYYSVQLKATNRGGHSSLPRPDNAIYTLAQALLKIRNYQFPVKLNEVTKLYLERTGPIAPGELGKAMTALAANPNDESAARVLSADPHENAILRTTCVPTRLAAGHADNALPQLATALVNCRLLPEDKPEAVLGTLQKVVDDPQIELTPMNVPRIGPTSPLTPSFMAAMEQATAKLWPGIPVIPIMSTGATDGRALRQAGIATYGVSGFFLDEADNREHGRDERIGVESFFEGRQFLYDFVKKLAK
jgi:acetylornithine deacetylase/succinyl-diaminopimelate desuccinylase-like protein